MLVTSTISSFVAEFLSSRPPPSCTFGQGLVSHNTLNVQQCKISVSSNFGLSSFFIATLVTKKKGWFTIVGSYDDSAYTQCADRYKVILKAMQFAKLKFIYRLFLMHFRALILLSTQYLISGLRISLFRMVMSRTWFSLYWALLNMRNGRI